MLKYNAGLLIGSIVLFTGTLAFASFQYDGAPSPDEPSQSTRKGGDMRVSYYGHRRMNRAIRRSSRQGSMHNRTYRGGGLHGGK